MLLAFSNNLYPVYSYRLLLISLLTHAQIRIMENISRRIEHEYVYFCHATCTYCISTTVCNWDFICIPRAYIQFWKRGTSKSLQGAIKRGSFWRRKNGTRDVEVQDEKKRREEKRKKEREEKLYDRDSAALVSRIKKKKFQRGLGNGSFFLKSLTRFLLRVTQPWRNKNSKIFGLNSAWNTTESRNEKKNNITCNVIKYRFIFASARDIFRPDK